MAKYDLETLERQVTKTRETIAGQRGTAYYDLTIERMREYISKVEWLCKLVRRLQKKIERLEKAQE